MPFQIIRNDITKVKADAIVNTANPEPLIGEGTDSAIYRAAGEDELLLERQKIGCIAPGQAAHTDAFRLDAKYIIHTVGPMWIDGEHDERHILRACYRNSLHMADNLNCASIAFPLIATGVYGFPKDEALQIALEEISRFLLTHDMQVILVVFDRKAFELSGRLVSGIEEFIDDHSAKALRDAEYRDKIRRNGQKYHRFERVMEDADDSFTEEELESPDAGHVGSAIPMPAGFEHFVTGKPMLADDGRFVTREPMSTDDESFVTREPMSADDECLVTGEPMPANPEHFAAADTVSRGADHDSTPAPTSTFPDVAGKSLDEFLRTTGDTFRQRLFQLIDERGMDDVTVYKKANIDRKVFSRIRCKADYRPKKKTAVALCVALELDMPDMLDLLARAEIAFSPSSRFDMVIAYFITNKIYDIFEINAALFKYGLPILGA